MRLNPFSKKSAGSSSGYYARIKAEFDQAERELAKTRKAHAQAQADYDAERAEYQRIKDSLNPRRVERSPQEDRQWARVTAAYDIVQPLASQLRSLEEQVRELRPIVEAPAKLQEAQAALKALSQKDRQTQAERERLQSQIAKIEARLAKAEVKVKEETLVASQQWADSTDSDEAAQTAFAPPAALMQAEIEVRMAKTSLEALQQQLQAVDASRVDLPQARHDARRAYQYARYLVSDIEMHEQLEPLLPVIARATSAAYDWSPYLEQRQYVIKLSDELVAQASSQLDAELEQL